MPNASILLEQDISLDPHVVAAVLARRLGYAMSDGKLVAVRARGLLISNIPFDRAMTIVQDLRGMEIPCYCVKEDVMKPLPPPRRIILAEWTADALEFRTSSNIRFEEIPWKDVAAMAVGLIKTEQFKSAVETQLLPNLPMIHAIDDDEAKRQLRERLAAVSAKRAEAAAQMQAEEKTNLAEKHDLAVARLLDKGTTEGLTGYMDLWITQAEAGKEIRARIIASEFMFSGLGSALRGKTMDNFRAIAQEFASRTPSARKTDTIRHLLGQAAGAYKATFDNVRQYESYLRWFIQMGRLAAHPEEFLVEGQGAAEPPGGTGESGTPLRGVKNHGQDAHATMVAEKPVDQTPAATISAEPAERPVRWHIFDCVLAPLSVLAAMLPLDFIRRVAVGRIAAAESFYGMDAVVLAIIAGLVLPAVLGAAFSTIGRGPSMFKRGILVFSVAIAVALFIWMPQVDAREDERVVQASYSFIREMQARHEAATQKGEEPDPFIKYFNPTYFYRVTGTDRAGYEADSTILINQAYNLRFHLVREGLKWSVARVARSREETTKDPNTGLMKKKLVMEELYKR